MAKARIELLVRPPPLARGRTWAEAVGSSDQTWGHLRRVLRICVKQNWCITPLSGVAHTYEADFCLWKGQRRTAALRRARARLLLSVQHADDGASSPLR